MLSSVFGDNQVRSTNAPFREPKESAPALPASPWPAALPAPPWHPWLPLSPGPLPLHGPGPSSLPLLRPRSACGVDITGYSAMIPVRSEHITFEVHISVWGMNSNSIYQRYMMSHSSAPEYVDVVNRNTVHAWCALITSWLSESGVLTRRDMQNMQGGCWGLELRTAGVNHVTHK